MRSEKDKTPTGAGRLKLTDHTKKKNQSKATNFRSKFHHSTSRDLPIYSTRQTRVQMRVKASETSRLSNKVQRCAIIVHEHTGPTNQVKFTLLHSRNSHL